MTDVTPGRDSTTVERFAGDFMDHDGVPGRVRLVTCGMSRGFQKDIREHLPHVRRIIDKFHVARHANEAALSDCFASMFVRQVRQCFSAVWADGFPRCRHRFPVM